MIKTFYGLLLLVCATAAVYGQHTENSIKDFQNYNFIPGEKTIFEDNLLNDKINTPPLSWNMEGGKAQTEEDKTGRYISVKEYYTKMTPKPALPPLPEEFTIEYDTWLDAGYDGNPGIEIHLQGAEDQEALITPNRDFVSCMYPGGQEQGETPPEIRGEHFYDKWNHIAIVYSKKSVTVFVNQFKVFFLGDCKVKVSGIMMTGNTSQDMKILFKNFRIAKEIPVDIAKDLSNGLLVTHGIKFDTGKSDLKPESMSVINQVAKFLNNNAGIKLEIGGHTDSDGDDNGNQKLSQQRAEAVKNQLLKMGIGDARLSAKGYGETKPMDKNTTMEGKANNRRVEFTKI